MALMVEPPPRSDDLAILICMLLTRRDPFSTADRISATCVTGPTPAFLNTWTVLAADLSCAMMTFSEPLITKYPPWS